MYSTQQLLSKQKEVHASSIISLQASSSSTLEKANIHKIVCAASAPTHDECSTLSSYMHIIDVDESSSMMVPCNPNQIYLPPKLYNDFAENKDDTLLNNDHIIEQEQIQELHQQPIEKISVDDSQPKRLQKARPYSHTNSRSKKSLPISDSTFRRRRLANEAKAEVDHKQMQESFITAIDTSEPSALNQMIKYHISLQPTIIPQAYNVPMDLSHNAELLNTLILAHIASDLSLTLATMATLSFTPSSLLTIHHPVKYKPDAPVLDSEILHRAIQESIFASKNDTPRGITKETIFPYYYVEHGILRAAKICQTNLTYMYDVCKTAFPCDLRPSMAHYISKNVLLENGIDDTRPILRMLFLNRTGGKDSFLRQLNSWIFYGEGQPPISQNIQRGEHLRAALFSLEKLQRRHPLKISLGALELMDFLKGVMEQFKFCKIGRDRNGDIRMYIFSSASTSLQDNLTSEALIVNSLFGNSFNALLTLVTIRQARSSTTSILKNIGSVNAIGFGGMLSYSSPRRHRSDDKYGMIT